MTPNFKSGDCSLCTKYRCIALLFEKLVFQKLEASLRQLIHPSQLGYRSGHSTQINLMVFVHRVLVSTSKPGQIAAVNTNSSQAFDRVDHELLIQKLRLMSVSGGRRRLELVQLYPTPSCHLMFFKAVSCFGLLAHVTRAVRATSWGTAFDTNSSKLLNMMIVTLSR